MTTTEPPRCQMWCTKVLTADDPEPLGGDWKNTCAACEAALKWVCKEVLPAIRRYGYWSPPGAGPDAELAAMVDQSGMRDRFREALEPFADVRTTDGRTLGEALLPPQEER